MDQIELLFCFNALRGDPDSKAVRQRDDAAHEGRVAVRMLEFLDERAIQLENVDRQALQVAKLFFF